MKLTATSNSLQNINLTPTNEINITPNNNGSGNVQSIYNLIIKNAKWNNYPLGVFYIA